MLRYYSQYMYIDKSANNRNNKGRLRTAIGAALLLASATSLLFVSSLSAESAKPIISWVVLDIPPIEIAYGPLKGQGSLDKIRDRFIEELPQYRHSPPILVNQERFLRLLPTGTFCHATLRSTAKFDGLAIQSIPHFTGFPDVIITTKKHQKAISQFGVPVPLQRVLTESSLTLGVPSRSMGKDVDDILRQYGNENNMLTRRSSEVGKDLLRMMLAGRLDYTIGFPSAKRSWEKTPEGKDVISFPIQELNDLIPIGHITCSDNELGRKFIDDSNKIIHKLIGSQEYINRYVLSAYPLELQKTVQERINSHVLPLHKKYEENRSAGPY